MQQGRERSGITDVGGRGHLGVARARRRRRPPRLLLPTERADLRVSWHAEDDGFVLSLWHGDVCAGSAPLSPAEAAEVASFLVGHLGERTRWVPAVVPDVEAPTQEITGARRRRARRGRSRILGRWAR
jgi:hypothetical protein